MGTGENPFIRFKNHIDNNVRRGRDYLFGSPPPSTSSPPTLSSPPDLVSQPPPPPLSQPPPSSKLKMTDRTPSTTTAIAASESESEQTTTMAEVHTWSIQSPYSPLNLQDLPQPTPRDAPPRTPFSHDSDNDITFTFRDAFEDLLVAGSGQPLPSILELVMKKRREIIPFWEMSRGLHVTSWVARLASRGLWDAYFRMEPLPPMRRPHPYDEKDVERQLYFRNSNSSSRNSHSNMPAAAAWPGGVNRRTGDDDFGAAWTGAWNDVIRRAAEVADDADPDKMNSALDDAKGVLDAVWKVALNRDLWKGGDDRETKAADVEEELYGGTTRSSTTTSKPPPSPPANNRVFNWDPKKNEWQLEESPPQQEGVSSSSSSSSGLSKPPSATAPEVTTTVYADGSKSVKTTSRIERNGKTKVTTTAQHFDPAGNLVSESRESSTTRTWSGGIPGAGASLSWSWNNNSNNDTVGTQRRRKSDDNSGGHDEDRDVDDHRQEQEEKKGWFWNR
ncbi:hypothetical protein FHL15_010943 [Xylaria flabelliformis]|uniref:Uncharacterized protein n=1 Tax=Xylaria flabelliformis TaxID=2512241 RepID=A0A553HJM0_9PEZI|nr:hypothetical protein FHL15_010943 [Xylaria flabelliformis]